MFDRFFPNMVKLIAVRQLVPLEEFPDHMAGVYVLVDLSSEDSAQLNYFAAAGPGMPTAFNNVQGHLGSILAVGI